MKNNGKPLVSDSVTTPHPPSPPSKAELIELIKAKIREAYKGPTNWNGDTFDEVAFWFSKAEEIIGGIIDDARKVYSLDELLEIFKSEFEE